MPRLAAATIFTAVLFLGAGCTGPVSSSPAPSPTTSPSQTSLPAPSVDPTAKAICDDLQRTILDTDTLAFGTELGRLLAAHLSGDTTAQAKAQQAAVTKLHEIVTTLRTHAAEATDPRLKTALNDAADNVDKLAADTGNFNKISSVDAVTQTTKRFVESFNEINKLCAAPQVR